MVDNAIVVQHHMTDTGALKSQIVASHAMEINPSSVVRDGPTVFTSSEVIDTEGRTA